MKKVLFVATVAKTHICTFHLPFLRMFQKMGYETYVAAHNDFGDEMCMIPYCDHFYDISTERSPLKKGNMEAYRQLRQLIEREEFDIIHCHTPIAAALTRMAARKARKRGTRVIYTAHGFHFFKGAPLLNWLLYYPIEKICSRWTDTLITINHEDYALAKKKMKATRVEYVPGVGVDAAAFAHAVVDREETRQKFGIPQDAFLVLSVGELNRNKNHKTVLQAIAECRDPRIHYAIAGVGYLCEELKALAESLGLADRFHLLGYRADVAELYKSADVFVHPSFREGLPVSVIEAMASGLPIIASDTRGNRDLVDVAGGYLCQPGKASQFAEKLRLCMEDPTRLQKMGSHNSRKAHHYDVESITEIMRVIYGGA